MENLAQPIPDATETASKLIENKEEFDPSIHATDKQGNPSMTPNGKFRRKRKPKAGGEDKPVKDTYDQAAEQIVNAVEMITTTIFNKELWAMSKDEKKNHNVAWSAFLRENEWDKIPSWLMVVGLSGIYVVGRVSQDEEAQAKIGAGASKLGKVKGLFSRGFALIKRRRKTEED